MLLLSKGQLNLELYTLICMCPYMHRLNEIDFHVGFSRNVELSNIHYSNVTTSIYDDGSKFV